jgi:hypothetical protein
MDYINSVAKKFRVVNTKLIYTLLPVGVDFGALP